MKISSTTGELQKVKLDQNQPPIDARLKITTHSVINDEDMKELHDHMAKGVQIIFQCEGEVGSYVTVREIVRSKISL